MDEERAMEKLEPVRHIVRNPIHLKPMGGPGRLCNCYECMDEGWVPVAWKSKSLGDATYEGVVPCPRCHLGLTNEASHWLDIVHPRGRNGKRIDSSFGKDRMTRHYGLRVKRLVSVEARMEELLQGNP